MPLCESHLDKLAEKKGLTSSNWILFSSNGFIVILDLGQAMNIANSVSRSFAIAQDKYPVQPSHKYNRTA